MPLFDVKQPIKEVQGCRGDDIPDFVKTSTEPLVLRGIAKSWPMVEHARRGNDPARDYLKSFYRGREVDFFSAAFEAKGRFFYADDLAGFNFSHGRDTLDNILDKLASYEHQSCPPSLFVGSTTVDVCLPGFRLDNDLGLDEHQPLASIWLGNRSRIAAHHDLPDNIACVAAGRRRFTLLPPDQLENLYIGPIDFNPAGQAISLVDFHNPDLASFPKFEKAMGEARVAELEPGDGIFIPSMWWHHVEGLSDFNVLVNYWWRRSPSYVGPPIGALYHSILTMRDLPSEQKKIWQAMLNYYVFNDDPKAFDHIPEPIKGSLGKMDKRLANKLKAMLASRLNNELKG